MSYKEHDIKHQNDKFWVLDTGNSYDVMKENGTHSICDSAYSHNSDGLSIAIARCDYLAKIHGGL